MTVEDALLDLLQYRPVVGAVATTTDGLVVASVGVAGDDAEVVAAAGSALAKALEGTPEREGDLTVRSGEIHLVVGQDMMLVTLTEAGAPGARLRPVMHEALVQVEHALQTDLRPA